MYLQNKYTRWYYNIIHRAQTRTISGYTEKHHIIPKSLDVSNTKDNLVALTAKEHFVCHRLLIKMTEGKSRDKMVFACWQLANQKNKHQNLRVKVNSRTYAKLRVEFAISHSNRMKENHHFKNPTIYKNFLESLKHRRPTSVKGRKHSESTIQKFKNKIWTEKAIQNRLDNCLKSAASRKGIKNPEHGLRIFANYVNANKEVILKIWNLYDQGLNRRQISIKLSISWDRVNVAINKRAQIDALL